MSKSISLLTTLVTSLIISVIVSAGFIFVAIPMIYPSVVNSNSLNILQVESLTVSDNQQISDNDVTFQTMNGPKINFTISNQSIILAQFVGDFVTHVYFGSQWTFEIALVIQGVGLQSASIEQTGVDSLNQYNTHNLVINYLSPTLPAGEYSFSIQWRSTFYHASRSAYLRTSYFNQDLVYQNTTRILTLWEIAS